MWDIIVGRLPSKIIMLNTCLSFFIPWVLYKCNKALLKYANPPWKETNKNKGD